MSPARLQLVEKLFHEALGQEPDQLSALLDKHCAGDDSLRREVEALLASHRSAGVFIETPVITLDASFFENGKADRLIGQTIGHYKILKTIGVGGMGVVYLAQRADQQYQKLVAIKLIKRGMDTDSVLRHFHNERQILASFDHPNIARLLDGDTTDSGLPYFVMEYVEGLPIDLYCDAQALSITERLKLFRQVCTAVSYAHRHAVIHRDLKPSNISVGTEGVPKLLDFGIAKILQPGEGVATMTGLRLMTPEYASPEQLRGESLTTATDVYSLGMVLYRLLTGRLPYRLPTESAYDVSRVITETEPQRPSAVVAAATANTVARDGMEKCTIRTSDGTPERLQRRLRGDLDNIVLMALRKEPERRYQSIEQFSEDIRRHLETLPVVARKDTLRYRNAKFVRRHRAATAATVLVFLSLLGGIMATVWQMHRARAQELVARAEKARAERRFNDVRKLANSVLFDYHDAIKDLSGATAIRERLVRDALVYLDSLAAEASDDPELERELAAAYERLGDVRGQPFTANIGDTAGAVESYLKALRIREALVASDPRDVRTRRDLAFGYVRIANQLIEIDEASRGMDYLRKALAIYLELSAEQPANSEIRYDLAAIYNELGSSLEDWWGDPAGALENHRKALSLREEFVMANPSNQTYRRDLSVTYVNIGRALVLSGDAKGALESNQKALAIRAALFSDNPASADIRRLLAISYQNDGVYRAMLHDMSGALQSFRKKLSLDERSFADDPVNAQTREDLGYSNERIGDLLADSGDYAQALTHYRKALLMYEKVSTVAPRILRVRYRVIFAHAGIGKMQAKLGQFAPAIVECSKAKALLNEIPVDPTSSWQSSMRGALYMQLAKAYAALHASRNLTRTEQQEHLREARNMYSRSLEIWQDMQKRGILSGGEASKPQEVAREIAKFDVRR